MKSIKKIDNGIVMHEGPSPPYDEGDVMIKMGACGICGSDLSNIFGKSCKPTTKIGHEVSGTIVKIGKNVKGFRVGDRVFVNHHAPCGVCYLCNAGRHTLCDGFSDNLEPCGMAEEFLVPDWNVNHGCLFKIPDSLSFEHASLIEPLACCLRAWKKIPEQLRSIAIFGSGPIGMIHALLAKHYGFQTIFCIDINEFRLKFAQKIGFYAINYFDNSLVEKVLRQTNNTGVDVAVIATSDMSTISKALDVVRKGGMVLLMGEPDFGSTHALDLSKLYGNEISIVSSYASANNDIKNALDLVSTHVIGIDQIITHKFSFDESTKAIEKARRRKDCLKIIVSGNDARG